MFNISTGWLVRMSHRKWRETKQQLSWLPDLALLGCCLPSLRFLCDILTGRPAQDQYARPEIFSIATPYTWRLCHTTWCPTFLLQSFASTIVAGFIRFMVASGVVWHSDCILGKCQNYADLPYRQSHHTCKGHWRSCEIGFMLDLVSS